MAPPEETVLLLVSCLRLRVRRPSIRMLPPGPGGVLSSEAPCKVGIARVPSLPQQPALSRFEENRHVSKPESTRGATLRLDRRNIVRTPRSFRSRTLVVTATLLLWSTLLAAQQTATVTKGVNLRS